MEKDAWKYTKRLIYGSLVCLSKDGFNSMIFATIADRNPDELMGGLVDIRFTERVVAQVSKTSLCRTFSKLL